MVPSKFYGVLAAGRPVIFVGPAASEVARVIAHERCGIIVPPGDGKALERAVRRLHEDPQERSAMGLRGRAVLQERFNTARACEEWYRLVHRIVEIRS
jgi:glycosyltransferase involved in cell wall biosynthesis